MFSTLSVDYLTSTINNIFKHTCPVCDENTYYYSNLITDPVCQNCRTISEKNELKNKSKQQFEEAHIDYKLYLKRLQERADKLDEDLEYAIEKEANRKTYNKRHKMKLQARK